MREDVSKFQLHLIVHLLKLHNDLKDRKFIHGPYIPFKINDPKPRDIHKATVRDRILHRALYRKLYPFFDRTFISDSYSCRIDKGTHRAFYRFNDFARRASRNHTKTVWILKCDIKKFFASIDHEILSSILNSYIPDQNILQLLNQIISSFHSNNLNVGMPLGNLTSQLFANIYMNEFDQFMKHKIKAEYYIRYADDFVILDTNHEYLQSILVKMNFFLKERLHLFLHPDKTFIKTFASGVDFLGWTHFPGHRVLRTT
ncbi:MAG: reverse transcriptase/maturase family protein, partial [Patescibacteria group bacterium]